MKNIKNEDLEESSNEEKLLNKLMAPIGSEGYEPRDKKTNQKKIILIFLIFLATLILIIVFCFIEYEKTRKNSTVIADNINKKESGISTTNQDNKTKSVGSLTASGLLKANQISTVSSEITGTVSKLYVYRGQMVSKGQPIAELDSSFQKNAVAQAKIELLMAVNLLNQTKKNLPIIKARYERQSSLSNSTSRQEVDNAKMELQNSLAEVITQQLKVESAKNLLDRSNINLYKTTIRAPFDGMITSLDAAEGEIVSPVSSVGSYARTGIATIISTTNFHIDVWVPESFLSKIYEGQNVEVEIEESKFSNIKGKVRFISPIVDESRAATLVQINLDDIKSIMKHNMTVSVTFHDQ